MIDVMNDRSEYQNLTPSLNLSTDNIPGQRKKNAIFDKTENGSTFQFLYTNILSTILKYLNENRLPKLTKYLNLAKSNKIQHSKPQIYISAV